MRGCYPARALRHVPLTLLLTTGTGCPHGQPPVSTPGPVDTEVAEPEPAVPSAAEDAPESPERVAHRLADQWCARGGTQFASPGGDPDAHPPSLESCADIATEVVHRRAEGSVSTAILELDAIYEEQEFLLYQTGATSHLMQLGHDYEDMSGEAGIFREDYASVRLLDVYGDAAPEWIAVITRSGGDSFEADRCYSHDEEQTTLMICTNTSDRLRCLSVDTILYSVTAPRPEDDLYDCEDAPAPTEEAHRSGYVSDAVVERGAVVFTRLHEPTMDEPEPPPYEGRVALDTLFDEAPFDWTE